MRIYWTIFAGLLGLAFGSFLNVCLSRWPEGESVVKPRSRCRTCGRTLTWWENIPVLSWLALRGRCRTCGTSIGARYVIVELVVGGLWAVQAWKFLPWLLDGQEPSVVIIRHGSDAVAFMLLDWLLIAMAVLDVEHLWLPDWITIPGFALGIANAGLQGYLFDHVPNNDVIGNRLFLTLPVTALISGVIAATLILLIRWLYQLIRHKEGLGLGDAKLMAMLAAWLGLPGALLAFFIGIVLGAFIAIAMLVTPKRNEESWATSKLPLGTFLCIGGIISSLWGQQIIDFYLKLSGF